MTDLEDELRAALHSQAESLRPPERPALELNTANPRRHSRQRWLIAGAACLVLGVVGAVLIAQQGAEDPSTVASGAPDTTAPVRHENGWVAFTRFEASGASDIYLARPGDDARRLEIAGSDASTENCPAWSPDGTRLMFGRLTGPSATGPGDADLVIVPISRDGSAGAPTVIALDRYESPEGYSPKPPPCGTWASDGRWVALPGRPDEVWVIDTETSEIRRLPNLRPVDLEWRPGTDQLALAGDVGPAGAERSAPVRIYSVSTGELRPLGTVEAGYLTWSPDGSTLAFSAGGDDDNPPGLQLVDADGTNERLLVGSMGDSNHGIGPVWSPTGDRIVYQRLIPGTGERHRVVLVNVADGSETVIEPPRAEGSDTVHWYPFQVSWSPDGTTLLYNAWRAQSGPTAEPVDGRGQQLTLRPDTPDDVTVLGPGAGWSFSTEHQQWGPQPG